MKARMPSGTRHTDARRNGGCKPAFPIQIVRDFGGEEGVAAGLRVHELSDRGRRDPACRAFEQSTVSSIEKPVNGRRVHGRMRAAARRGSSSAVLDCKRVA
jgi:hypothetical protein